MIPKANEKWYVSITDCPKCQNATFYSLTPNSHIYGFRQFKCLFCQYEKMLNV